MPNYTRNGKIQTTISVETFKKKMQKIQNEKQEYRSFIIILYYFGLRVTEVLNLTSDLFDVENNRLIIDVQKRLKHGKKTAPLSVRLDAPYVREILVTLREATKRSPQARIWRFSRVTAWKIVAKTFNRYPHYFRLNRITKLFSPSPTHPNGYSIQEVKSFTGLTLQALDYYIGLSNNIKIGESLE